MSATNQSLDLKLQHLREVRQALLRLHKALLESERIVYEQFYGRIQSTNEFFQLVVNHDWFSWLRPISQFIVQIDTFLGSKEPVTLNEANQLLEEARMLIDPAEEGPSLKTRYYRAIQRDPAIALMHAEVSKLLVNDV